MGGSGREEGLADAFLCFVYAESKPVQLDKRDSWEGGKSEGGCWGSFWKSSTLVFRVRASGC